MRVAPESDTRSGYAAQLRRVNAGGLDLNAKSIDESPEYAAKRRTRRMGVELEA